MSSSSDKLIAFSCKSCGKRLKSPEKGAGRHIKCPKCSETIRIPKPKSEKNLVDREGQTGLLDMDDPFALDAPAIGDLEDRKHTSDEIRARKEKERAIERAKQKRRKQKSEDEEQDAPEEKPVSIRKATKADQYSQPMKGEANLDDDGNIPFDSLDEDEIQIRKKPVEDEALDASDPDARTEESPDDESYKLAPSSFEEDLDVDALRAQSEFESARPSSRASSGSSSKSKPAKKKKPAVVEEDLKELDDLVPELDDDLDLPKLVEDEVLEQREYRIVCPTCGTGQYVSPSAKGMKVKCPDCFSLFKAPGPPKDFNKKPKKPKLSPNVEMALAADAEFDEKKAKELQRGQSQKVLQKAQTEIDEEEEDRLYKADFDTADFAQSTFGFLKDPLVLIQVGVYGLVFAGLFYLTALGLNTPYSVLAMIGGPAVGLVFAMPMLSGGLALIETAANKQRYLREIPAFNIFDNFADVLVIVIAFIASIVPGFMLGSLVGGDMTGAVIICTGCTLFSGFLLFPIFLLSQLDYGSLFALVSGTVIRSVTDAKESWGGYYMKTGVACFVIFLLWAFLLGGEDPLWPGIAGLLVPLLIFFICQQIGALADSIGDQLSFAFELKDDKDDEDDRSSTGPHYIEDEL